MPYLELEIFKFWTFTLLFSPIEIALSPIRLNDVSLIKIFDPDKSIPSPIIFLNSDFTISPDEKSLSIPSEEVFTTPHCLKVDGHVSSTKPLSHQGSLIEGIRVEFKEGKIINAKADKGEKVFNKVLDSDEGARRLGEVALVPDSSPISQSNILFYNTLFDENAACHIALGQCYSKCFKNFESLTNDDIKIT